MRLLLCFLFLTIRATPAHKEISFFSIIGPINVSGHFSDLATEKLKGPVKTVEVVFVNNRNTMPERFSSDFYVYNQQGKLTQFVQRNDENPVTGALNDSIIYIYNNGNQLAETRKYKRPTRAVEEYTIYTYNSNGAMITMQRTDKVYGYTTTHQFNNFGDEISRTSIGKQTADKSYEKMSYIYNASGLKVSCTYTYIKADTNIIDITYQYDDSSNLVVEEKTCKATGQNMLTHNEYDHKNRLTHISSTNSYSTRYDYSGDGILKSEITSHVSDGKTYFTQSVYSNFDTAGNWTLDKITNDGEKDGISITRKIIYYDK